MPRVRTSTAACGRPSRLRGSRSTPSIVFHAAQWFHGARERPRQRFDAIGDDRDLVPLEHVRDLRPVGLRLLVGAGDLRVRLAGALELEQRHRQAVDEQQDVRPPRLLRPLDR